MADDQAQVEQSILKIMYDANGSPLGLADDAIASSSNGNHETASATRRGEGQKKRKKKKKKQQKEKAVTFDSDGEIEVAAPNNSKLISSIKSLMKLPLRLMKWNKIKPHNVENETNSEEKHPIVPLFHAPRVIQTLHNTERKVASNINAIVDSPETNNAEIISIESPPLAPPSADKQSVTAEKTSFLNYFSYSPKKSQRENTDTDTLATIVSDNIEQAVMDTKESVVSTAEGITNSEASEQTSRFNHFAFNSVDTTSIANNALKPFSLKQSKVTSEDGDCNLSLVDALTKEKNALFQRTKELEEEVKLKEAGAIKKIKAKYESILQERDSKRQTELSNQDILNKYDVDLLKRDYELKLKLANDMLSDYSSKYQGSQQEVGDLKGKYSVLQRNYNDLENSYAIKQEELDVEKNEIELLLAADSNIKKKIAFLNDEISTLRRQCGLKDKIIIELNESLDTQMKIGKQQEYDFKKKLDDALSQVEVPQKGKSAQDSSLSEKYEREIKGLVHQIEKKNNEIRDLMQITEELQVIANSVKSESTVSKVISSAREDFEESKTTLSRTNKGAELSAHQAPLSPAKGKFISNSTPAIASTSISADPFDFSMMTSLMSNVHKK